MERIIGLFTLGVSAVYFYAFTYYMLLEPETWKIIVAKPYKGKQYRIIEGHVAMVVLLGCLGIIFPILGHPALLGPWQNYHSFAWFAFAVALVMFIWSLYVAIQADRGYYFVACAIIIFNFLFLKGILLADPTWCWVLSGGGFLFAIYKRQKTKKIQV